MTHSPLQQSLDELHERPGWPQNQPCLPSPVSTLASGDGEASGADASGPDAASSVVDGLPVAAQAAVKPTKATKQ